MTLSSVIAAVPSATPSVVPPSNAAPDAAPLPSPAVDPEVERLIVWGEPAGALGAESFWLEWRPPKLEVRGKRTGALIFVGGGVYRFQKTKGIGHGLHDCTPVFQGSAPIRGNQFKIEVIGASAKRLDAEGDIVISAPESVEDASSYENTVTLDASIGSFLFISEHANFSYCTAAHPGSTNSYYLYDLEKRGQVEFPTKSDIEGLRGSARRLSSRATKDCLDISVAEGSGEKPSLDGLDLDFAIPRWAPKRGLYTELGFAIMRSYVEGLKTCGLEVSGLPPSLEAVRIPAAFAELPRTLRRLKVLGWSIVPPDAEANAAVERAFSNKRKR